MTNLRFTLSKYSRPGKLGRWSLVTLVFSVCYLVLITFDNAEADSISVDIAVESESPQRARDHNAYVAWLQAAHESASLHGPTEPLPAQF